MTGAITDVPGVEVGHAGDQTAITGCTVILTRQGAVVGVDVRGSAPGTRETDLCRPGTLVERAHAVLLTGGSALGLEAAAGVMRYLHGQNIGFQAGTFSVPIVPAAVIFDLAIGQPIWPDTTMGHAACIAASSAYPAEGCAGAGLGATVGGILGPAQAMKSGIGTASLRIGGTTVGAIVVVNAFGHVHQPASGTVLAGARDPATNSPIDTVPIILQGRVPAPATPGNTVIGVVATDAALTSAEANRLATVAHDGIASAIAPAHTPFDGDTLFALATGHGPAVSPAEMLALGVAAVTVVEQSIVRAVTQAVSMGGLPALIDLPHPPSPLSE
jgi:L-aminopeptidase/D-esterase-like protein